MSDSSLLRERLESVLERWSGFPGASRRFDPPMIFPEARKARIAWTRSA